TLEDDVTVIAQTTILGHTYYPRHFHRLLGDEETRADLRTTIRRGAYLGLRSTILAGVTVGEYAIVGAGSVVTSDVPPFTMVAGVPARVVREFGPDDVDPAAQLPVADVNVDCSRTRTEVVPDLRTTTVMSFTGMGELAPQVGDGDALNVPLKQLQAM